MANRKDLRFVRTNQMLCDAFIELLSKKKFEDITVNELCEKALIRRATFYTHFLDKYDFFAYFVRHTKNIFVSTYPLAQSGGGMKEFSLHMFRQIVHFLSEHMAMVQNAMSSNAFSILLDLLGEEIRVSFLDELSKIQESTHSQSLLSSEILPEVAAAYYSGGIIQILRYWLTTRGAVSEDVLVEQYSALLSSFHFSDIAE